MIKKEIGVHASLDRSIDAAYIYLPDVIPPGGAVRTVCVDPRQIGGMVNLDLDSKGRIVGIEILDASRLLSSELLARLAND